MRGLSIALANGKTIPLVELFPRPRQIHCYFIDCVVRSEKAWLAEGRLKRPLPDEGIAEILEREYGIHVSRRTVANIRHALAISNCRRRGRGMNYLTATEGFSALVPLTPQALRTRFRPIRGCTRSGRALLPALEEKTTLLKEKFYHRSRTVWSTSAPREIYASA